MDDCLVWCYEVALSDTRITSHTICSAAAVLSRPVLAPTVQQTANQASDAAAIRLWLAWDYVEEVAASVAGVERAFVFLSEIARTPQLC